MAHDEKAIADLEKQVDDVLKELDTVLNKTEDGAGFDDVVDHTGAASDNSGRYRRRVRLHDQQPDPNNDEKLGKAAEIARLEKELERANMALEAVVKAGAKDMEDEMDGGADEAEEGNTPPKKTKKSAEKVEKSAADGDVVEIDGQRIAKADVGEAQFAILKSMNERLLKTSEQLAKAEEVAETERLKKRADDEYPHVPGSTDERAAMLKAMNGMSEEVRKSF